VSGKLVWLALCVGTLALSVGCAKHDYGVDSVLPTVSPSPGATATPTALPSAACNTTESSNPNLVLIGIGSEVTTVTDPVYGQIAGYALFDGYDIPDEAQVISTTASGAAITSANTVQFTNIELGEDEIYHSAVSFSSQSFPAVPYVFPSPAATPANTVIGDGFWSTGRIPPAENGYLCFSQEFTLEPGTYYFGDLDFYNTITSYRDVLVVQP
jgi:hypothetical protein